jgi:hypothetical protein
MLAKTGLSKKKKNKQVSSPGLWFGTFYIIRKRLHTSGVIHTQLFLIKF